MPEDKTPTGAGGGAAMTIRAACALLAGCIAVAGPVGARAPDDGAAQLRQAIAGRVAGKPTDCIDSSDISSSQIIPGTAIVYRALGRLYVNVPMSGARLLRRDDVLVTRQFGSQLCRLDTVRLLDPTSRIPHGFLGLGQFVPYTRPKR